MPHGELRERDAAAPKASTVGSDRQGGVVFSNVAWWPRQELDHHEWASAGRRLGAIGRCSQWWIGDWIRYGTAQWGERYAEASRITGYDVASLRNMAWVASQFDDLSLRSDKLTWSHHVLLAPLSREEKLGWLERAATEKLSVADLRVELRAQRRQLDAAQSTLEAHEPGEADDEADEDVVCPQCGHRLMLSSRA